MRTIRFAAALAIALLASWVPAQAQGTFKVGVFDPQRVSVETADGQRAQAALKKMQEQKQQKISDQEKAVADLQQQLSSQALSLSIDKRTSLELDIQRRLLELNTSKDLANRELQLEVAAEEARFNEKMRVVIETFARDEDFDLILDAGAVAWASEAIDVTSPIIEQFNKMFPGTAAQGASAGEGD
jgi:outer membrane protein